jgi:hypothetical protein
MTVLLIVGAANHASDRAGSVTGSHAAAVDFNFITGVAALTICNLILTTRHY